MFQVNINPEDVNRLVTDAIVTSALGQKLTESINTSLKECIDGYDSPVKKICKELISAQIKTIMNQPENLTRIQAAITRHITDKFLEDVITRSVQRITTEINSSY